VFTRSWEWLLFCGSLFDGEQAQLADELFQPAIGFWLFRKENGRIFPH
jgi:hypothetical protein